MMPDTLPDALSELLLDHVRDSGSAWSCGSFGALAEFHRDASEPVHITHDSAIVVATARGAMRIEPMPELRPIAYETLSRDTGSWGQGVALCLPRELARMNGRTVVTELGPDVEAVRPADRSAILFDLGLGMLASEICIRVADPETIAALRAICDRPFFRPDNVVARHMPALSPHRVFRCRSGRIEVYQPIPAPHGKTPDGPHTHVREKLLARGRSHAATVPIPKGLLSGMSLFPAHPLQNAAGQATPFDRERYEAFQSLLERFGDPELMAGKAAAQHPGQKTRLTTRSARTGFRVAQRQLALLQG